METRTRTLIKAVSWRVAGSMLTASLAWAATGQVQLALLVGLADSAVKIAAFYVHERLWLKIKFGLAPR